MKTAAIIALILAATGFAGCSSSSVVNGETSSLNHEPSTTMPVIAYLDADYLLSPDMPDEASAALDWSTTQWTDGTMPPLWEGEAAKEDYVMTNASATITYQAQSDLVKSDPRPGFTIWLGAGDAIYEHSFHAGPSPWAAGDVQTVTFVIDSLPTGGLVIEEGQKPQLRVGSYYPDGNGQNNVHVLFGGAAPSVVSWNQTSVVLPETNDSNVLMETGDLRGGRCLADANPGESAEATFSFAVTNETVGIDAILERVSGTGGPDLDFFLRGPEGDLVAYGLGSSSPEALHLRLPNLAAVGPGDWSVTAYNCQPQDSVYRLSIDLLIPA